MAGPPDATAVANEVEPLLASFRPDLDEYLRYAESEVRLTARELCCVSNDGSRRTFQISAALELVHAEHAGLSQLDVLEHGVRELRIHYTLGCSRAAQALVDTFQSLTHARTSSVRPPAVPEDGASGDFETRPGFPLLRLLRFARPRAATVAGGLALTIATTVAGLVPPYLTMPLIDRVLVPGQAASAGTPTGPALERVFFYLGGLALAAIVAWLLAWMQGIVLARVSERVSADLRIRTFSHLQKLSLHYFGGKRTGDLIARISSDTDHLCSFLSDTLLDFVTDVLMVTATAVVLFSLDPLLAAAALISFPPIAWLIVRVRGKLSHGFLRGGRVWSSMTSILADTIPGIRVVKAFSQEQREVARFAEANERIVAINGRNNALWTFFWPLVALLNQLGLLVVWAVGAQQVLDHHITVGVLTAFIAYISRFYVRVESMSRMLGAAQRAGAAATRLFEILDREPTVLEPTAPRPLTTLEGDVRFDRVSFRYGSRLILEDLSFEVKRGQMVGIVGHTGSGKSTVANLLCRFYDVAAGRVMVDGIDIRELSLAAYRSHIGIVLQDPFLFFGSIAENIAYGDPNAERARVVAAARSARAHDFVLKLPEGYDSLVGERGQALSGGERQRVAIARAILVDPQLLILDEATSAIDTRTEREIQRALDNVVAGRTTIAIAHRLSTLRKADRILVLKDGKLVEQGTRAELLALNGEYAELERAQARNRALSLEDEPLDEGVLDEDEDDHEPSIAPGALRLALDSAGRLLASEAETSRSFVVRPRRAFPLSDPGRFICFVDARGHERCCVPDLRELSAETREVLLRALAQHLFLPLVERIETLVHGSTHSEWQVLTDRGRTRFVVEQEDHVRRLDDGRHLVTDALGMRYVLPQAEELDARSRHLLARFH